MAVSSLAAAVSTSMCTSLSFPCSSRYTFVAPTYNGLRACPIPRLQTRANIVHQKASSSSVKIICASKTMEEVQEIIANQLSVDIAKVNPETKFSELGADSLDTVEIVMSLEEKFGVSINEESAGDITTVQQVADLIEKQKVTAA